MRRRKNDRKRNVFDRRESNYDYTIRLPDRCSDNNVDIFAS